MSIDIPGREIRFFLYLSDAKGEEVARILDAGSPASALSRLKPCYQDAVRHIILTKSPARIRVFGPEEQLPSFVLPVIASVVPKLADIMAALLGKLAVAIANYLRSTTQDFIDAARDPTKDGLTIVVGMRASFLDKYDTGFLARLRQNLPSFVRDAADIIADVVTGQDIVRVLTGISVKRVVAGDVHD